MSKKYIDYLIGNEKEKQLLPIIKTYFNDETICHLSKYDTYDYKGNNKFIELKSRNNKMNTYDKTMIGYNKILKAASIDEDVYFFFWFIDGIFFYKFNKEDKFEVKISGRYDRIRSGELSYYSYIPINLLQRII
jgi:hypothetical protein